MSDYKRGEERIWRISDVDVHRASCREVGELVRCKDCIYWKDEDFCANPQWLSGVGTRSGVVEFPCTFPDEFCSYAEKEEATDER